MNKFILFMYERPFLFASCVFSFIIILVCIYNIGYSDGGEYVTQYYNEDEEISEFMKYNYCGDMQLSVYDIDANIVRLDKLSDIERKLFYTYCYEMID